MIIGLLFNISPLFVQFIDSLSFILLLSRVRADTQADTNNMHGPQSYSEKTSLLRDQRSQGAAPVRSDGHRVWSGGARPTHAAGWSSRPRSRPGVSPEQAVTGCFGICALYFFMVVGLVSLGLFLHIEFAQTLPPYVRKVAIIGKYRPLINMGRGGTYAVISNY